MSDVRRPEELDDDYDPIVFPGGTFCLTGEFAYGTKADCAGAIEKRGGRVVANVTTRLHYLIVGSRGGPHWKYRNAGTKIEKAIRLNEKGYGIRIAKEEEWVAYLGESFTAPPQHDMRRELAGWGTEDDE